MSSECMMALSLGGKNLTGKDLNFSIFNVYYYCRTSRNPMGPTEFAARRKHAICKEQLNIIFDGFLEIFVLFIFLLS